MSGFLEILFALPLEFSALAGPYNFFFYFVWPVNGYHLLEKFSRITGWSEMNET